MEVNRLSPVLGAEVRGLDVSQPLGGESFAAVRRAWVAHNGLLVIRDQHLEPEQQLAFSRNFGPLFGETLGYSDLSRLLVEGRVIKATKLSDEFDARAYSERYGDRAVPLFVSGADGRLRVVTADGLPDPVSGDTIMSFVKDDEAEGTG